MMDFHVVCFTCITAEIPFARVKELRVGLNFLKKEGLYWMVDTVLNLCALIAVPLSQTFYY